MRTIEIARRLAALGQSKDACQAYTLAVNDIEEPAEKMEAAMYILQSGGDYRISYTCFLELYGQGCFQEDAFSIMTEAFYRPNEKELRARYEKNCKLLTKYPYLFRKDFVPFDDLPIRFYPFADNSYLPFYTAEKRFGDCIDFKDPVVRRNYFKDLENPVLADDVYSQYELEYLNDNVRESEYIARENHLYLHYTNWKIFCSYLTCLNLRPLLIPQKIVFLIGDEISQYPIDFKERFGIDYSKYNVRPVGIREITRMIWATQLNSHNGGDFFNEIFDDHPNLVAMPSYILDELEEVLNEILASANQVHSLQEAFRAFAEWKDPRLIEEFYRLRDRTSKDALVALYLREKKSTAPHLDERSRIVPALFFQPHFYSITYELHIDEKNRAVLHSKQYEQIKKSPIFCNFKYIKTFTPMRRMTTSYAATVKFMLNSADGDRENGKDSVVGDAVMNRVLNRSFMIDKYDRLYRDSRLVRFEDGKLNPRATFTALAAFVDLPYTESMTYCSLWGEHNPESLKGNDIGFNPAAIYRTNDEYASDAERTYIEYFMRDAYAYYGYNFNYYDGTTLDEGTIKSLLDGFTTLDRYMRETWIYTFRKPAIKIMGTNDAVEEEANDAVEEQIAETLLNAYMEKVKENRKNVTDMLLPGLNFINKDGQPLHMMPKLELDPALLEQPLYH